ncbi:MAG: IS5/IS1182 family transposase [Hydrogenophilales bacterium 17-61-76]|nr:MAG: IS5/IS1182 family transposase [Hydrogenophilales bacterium 17-61-76]
MKRFIEGENRTQITLLPECLDDYISEDNPIRAVEVFIDELDLGTLGFAGATPAATGRPSYHPAVLLKLYLYGYLNRIQSRRRLEREAQRNVELMWLTGRLSPDFKTIAFKAVNAHDRNFTQAKLDKRIQEVEHSIDRYLAAMETADRNPSDVTETKTTHLHKKIEHLKQQMQDLKAMQTRLNETPSGQISLTDPDARAMATSTSRGLVGYNVQTAVDARHHLIVAHEVTNVGSDRRQLVKMAKQAQAVLETPELQVVADRGYFNGDDILACDEAGITAYVPKPMTSEARAQGRFDKADFVYDPDTNTYRCPAGSQLIRRFARVEAGHLIHRYWSSDCPHCAIKEKCTPSENRRVSRWEHEAVLEAMQGRLDRSPGMMRIRRQTVEHPFGTIKFWMGARHFLMRTLGHVQTEMSLHVLAYNLKRMIKIVGMGTLKAAMRA